ncbi:OLC1v1022974C2 [Oldenlandia corymbosa var. corymbosa]|nr:OLC1v1022974C2 [Oldenlandia corymbosa var. corymbosa]
MLSPYSLARQMNDQISIAKGLIEIANERSDVRFAMDLTSQISHLQVILSDAAIRDHDGSQSTLAESKAAIQNMAFLLNEAQQLEYDAATTIVKLKDKIDNLELETRSINEKSSKYGQIAAEAIQGIFTVSVLD